MSFFYGFFQLFVLLFVFILTPTDCFCATKIYDSFYSGSINEFSVSIIEPGQIIAGDPFRGDERRGFFAFYIDHSIITNNITSAFISFKVTDKSWNGTFKLTNITKLFFKDFPDPCLNKEYLNSCLGQTSYYEFYDKIDDYPLITNPASSFKLDQVTEWDIGIDPSQIDFNAPYLAIGIYEVGDNDDEVYIAGYNSGSISRPTLTILYNPPVNGQCGAANGSTYTSPPPNQISVLLVRQETLSVAVSVDRGAGLALVPTVVLLPAVQLTCQNFR